jgi:hypothetical protein
MGHHEEFRGVRDRDGAVIGRAGGRKRGRDNVEDRGTLLARDVVAGDRIDAVLVAAVRDDLSLKDLKRGEVEAAEAVPQLYGAAAQPGAGVQLQPDLVREIASLVDDVEGERADLAPAFVGDDALGDRRRPLQRCLEHYTRHAPDIRVARDVERRDVEEDRDHEARLRSLCLVCRFELKVVDPHRSLTSKPNSTMSEYTGSPVCVTRWRVCPLSSRSTVISFRGFISLPYGSKVKAWPSAVDFKNSS